MKNVSSVAKIYEDQTGLMIYPEIKTEKDAKIVSFFNNNIDLYIEKMGSSLTIYCHFIAYKKSARPLGYYVIYNDNYDDDTLYSIKDNIYEILKNMDLQLRSGHPDNMVLENLDKLGLKYDGIISDQMINALNSSEVLDYRGGKIEEILIFYKELLKKINNARLTVSTVENMLGNVNILINRKIREPLVPSDRTKEILDRYSQKIIENKNRKEAEIGKNKIKEGFAIMKDGIDVIKGTGADPTYICIDELGKIIDINKIKRTDSVDIEEKKGIGTGSIVLVGIIMLFVGIILGPTVLSHIPAEITNMIPGLKTPTPIPTVVDTPTPKVTIQTTPMQNVAQTTTVAVIIPNNQSINNTANSTNHT